ncbi:uncharacterized protein BXZ73DRAFT_46204, partial [Epithele typhae]|uniref:uncharacterized protein n=1 Tax=Epithele typhae TaxID=378194 RepID=UPI0020087625
MAQTVTLDAAGINALIGVFQQFQQPLPAALHGQPRAQTVRASGPKLREPTTFDGKFEHYRDWKHEITNYVGGLGDHQAFSLILSYITRFISANTNAAGAWTIADKAAFWTLLDTEFLPLNDKYDAMKALERLKQNNLPAQSFYNEWEDLMTRSGEDRTAQIWMSTLLQALNPYLVGQVFNSGVIPADYNAWKTR